MSNSKGPDDYTNLKTLLLSWRMPFLFEHLKAEEVNVEELQMMKRHHVSELLSNFSMGTRIRFEFNLEKWRRVIDKPLDAYTRTSTTNRTTLTTQQTDFTNSNAKPNNMTTMKIQPTTNKLTSTITNTEAPKVVFQQVPLVVPTQLTKTTPVENNNIININRPFNEKGKTVITVLKILQNAGQKGLSLLEFYEKYKFFTDFQRQLLIQLIVYYFTVNEYHLSLHASYILEKQIIKLFPTEKLESYRTGKRGKIYIKFCNMKRKREDPEAVTTSSILSQLPIEISEAELQLDTTSKNENLDVATSNDILEGMDFTAENSCDDLLNADNIKTEYLSE